METVVTPAARKKRDANIATFPSWSINTKNCGMAVIPTNSQKLLR
jgi:hypothetical protein